MTKTKNTFARKEIMKRYGFIVVVAFIIGVAIIGKIFYLSLVQGAYWSQVSKQFSKKDSIAAQRGNIYDCNGLLLATSLPEYRMFMDFMVWEPKEKLREKLQFERDSILTADIDSICRGIHAIFPDVKVDSMKRHILKGREKESHHWPIINRRVTYIQYCEMKKLPLFKYSANKGGFHTTTYSKRCNPYGRLAIRTVGDLYGEKDSARCGLELTQDSVLRGHCGYGHTQKQLNKYKMIVDKVPEDGLDVVTTLDVSIQDICEKALSDQILHENADFGVCILMEVATGDIKAITSLDRLSNGTCRELQNRAISQMLEPGSVFKTVSFMVGLDEGVFNLDQTVNTGKGEHEMYGRKMRDSNFSKGGNGTITASKVLEKSSNIGTSLLIDAYYHNQPEKFVEAVYRTGIAEDLHLPLLGYAKPNIRMPKKQGRQWLNWSNTALAWMSIGYETQVPPISTITFYNGIANNGRLLAPRFIKCYKRGDEVVQEFPVTELRASMAKASTIKDLQGALRRTVIQGTGKLATSKLVPISGKTGTAEIWTAVGKTNKRLVSFVGYFPSDKPKYSCMVCMLRDSPFYGSRCCPVFKRIAETVMALDKSTDYSQARDTTAHGLIAAPHVLAGNMNATKAVLDALGIPYKSQKDASQWGYVNLGDNKCHLMADLTQSQKMPDLTNYGLRDAVYRLERMGLRVKVAGKGRVVSQSIPVGADIKAGQTVQLVLSLDGKDVIEVPHIEKTDSSKTAHDTLKTVKSA